MRKTQLNSICTLKSLIIRKESASDEEINVRQTLFYAIMYKVGWVRLLLFFSPLNPRFTGGFGLFFLPPPTFRFFMRFSCKDSTNSSCISVTLSYVLSCLNDIIPQNLHLTARIKWTYKYVLAACRTCSIFMSSQDDIAHWQFNTDRYKQKWIFSCCLYRNLYDEKSEFCRTA